jgi:hypothetical protein
VYGCCLCTDHIYGGAVSCEGLITVKRLYPSQFSAGGVSGISKALEQHTPHISLGLRSLTLLLPPSTTTYTLLSHHHLLSLTFTERDISASGYKR